MATFNDVDLGLVLEWSTTAAPKDRQINAYNGVDGLESTDLGARGGQTSLRALIAGVDVPGLGAVKAGFRGMQIAGGAAVLIDPEDAAWGNVVLVMFRPVGPRMLMAGDAGVCQEAEFEFLHLS